MLEKMKKPLAIVMDTKILLKGYLAMIFDSNH
jgi:hypothetical protein